MTARLEQLRKLLEKSPSDAFLLYATALELKKAGDSRGALDHLAKTLAVDADYMYAYYQQGQILKSIGDPAAAIIAYDIGVSRAQKKGDQKALGELRGARDMLE